MALGVLNVECTNCNVALSICIRDRREQWNQSFTSRINYQLKTKKNLKISESESMPTKETAQSGEAQEDDQYFETVIIGSGFSGLLAAIRLQKKRCNDFVLLERSSELGGTWQVNSYPGAEVDIPTSLYSISTINKKFIQHVSVITISTVIIKYLNSKTITF